MADDKSGNVVQSTIIRIDHLCCQGEAALVRKLLEPFEACQQNANTRGRSTQDPSVAARNERSRASQRVILTPNPHGRIFPFQLP